jgi:hypothetical protein
MTMFTWLARARDLEDRFPSDPRVSERVPEIAARPGAYAKAYGPGTVQPGVSTRAATTESASATR